MYQQYAELVFGISYFMHMHALSASQPQLGRKQNCCLQILWISPNQDGNSKKAICQLVGIKFCQNDETPPTSNPVSHLRSHRPEEYSV